MRGGARTKATSGGHADAGGGPAVSGDLLAGLTLAAIAIPEQMATARLGGFPPQFGFFAFIAASLAFFALGSNRFVSVGADSTITPVFAGALAAVAAVASPHYFALAAALALMVGAMVIIAGVLRMGWIADLLSVPVTIGFLAGIAAHIIASQLPGALGLPGAEGGILRRLIALGAAAPRLDPYVLAISAGVLALTAAAHRISVRVPGPLVAMVLATLAVRAWRLEDHGVAVLGAVRGGLPAFVLPRLDLDAWMSLAPTAFLVALIIAVQTAATSRAFPSDPAKPPELDRDYVGVGLGSLLAGLAGVFPVNASPPRSAAVKESGGRTKIAGLVATAGVAAVLLAGTGLLASVPQAALSGVLLFIALRIIRVGEAVAVARSSPAEFLLILLTAAAIILLPIATGVAVGVALSLLNGMWSSARPRVFAMQRLPGTTIWWPGAAGMRGDTVQGVSVLGFQAPMFFFNAYAFRREMLSALSDGGARLVVLEAAGVIDIDYTAAEVFADVVAACRSAGAEFALARLESVEAQRSLDRFGLREAIGADHIFSSVEEAIAALAPAAPTAGGV